jgi:hypothetical protein
VLVGGRIASGTADGSGSHPGVGGYREEDDDLKDA